MLMEREMASAFGACLKESQFDIQITGREEQRQTTDVHIQGLDH